MAVVTRPAEQKTDPVIEEMMKAGLQFGHKTSKTHPKMKPFITGVRNTVHILELEKTKQKLDEMQEYIKALKKEGKVLLMVGTKVQHQGLVQETAKACGLPYVSERWIGGTLTNFETIAKRIERLKELEEQKASGEWEEKYTKKEQQDLGEELESLEATFGGIKELSRLPDAVFLCDLEENQLAVREAQKKNIPIVAIADTNTNPEQADCFVPANDDAVSSVQYILDKVKEAWTQA